jgi:hypothetical protein
MLRVEINSAFAPPPLIFRSFDLLKFSFLLMTFRMSAAAGGANNLIDRKKFCNL